MGSAAAADIRSSDWVQGQALDVTDVDQAIYDRINEKYGLDVQVSMRVFLKPRTRNRAH
jgi:hypothetical protein